MDIFLSGYVSEINHFNKSFGVSKLLDGFVDLKLFNYYNQKYHLINTTQISCSQYYWFSNDNYGIFKEQNNQKHLASILLRAFKLSKDEIFPNQPVLSLNFKDFINNVTFELKNKSCDSNQVTNCEFLNLKNKIKILNFN